LRPPRGAHPLRLPHPTRLVISSSSAPTAAAPRTWRVGTLVYTSAGLLSLTAWLLWGDFAWWMRERSAMPMVQLLLKKLQASDFITSVFLILIPSVTMLVIGPIVSTWSDRHRGRWGRRIPFLVATTPVVTIGMVGLGLSIDLGRLLNASLGGNPELLHLHTMCVVGVFWAIFEIGALTANGVFGALINDVVPREMLGRFFGVFRAVSLATGVLFNYKIIGHAEEHFREIFIGIGVLYAAGLLLMCLKVREGDYPPPEPRNPADGPPFVAAFRTYLRECFTTRYNLLAIGFFAVGNLAFIPVNTFMLSAAKNYGMPMETYGRYFVAMFLISFVLAFPLGWLADKFHPLRVGCVALVAYGTAAFASFLLIDDARSFGWALLGHGILSGCFFTGAASVNQRLFPQLKFAQFSAAASAAHALLQIGFGPALGGYLDLMDSDYRYAFLSASIVCAATLVIGLVLLRVAPQVDRS
jgi:MFS family permease